VLCISLGGLTCVSLVCVRLVIDLGELVSLTCMCVCVCVCEWLLMRVGGRGVVDAANQAQALLRRRPPLLLWE
jgi:hypothetical protein